ncbi:DUF368 domain-containing protein [Arachnia propionica]|uniref:DUF368 domain-containing protein n=1 Tax=Arachnia propionica TaxID=1750 RepID=A0AB37HTW9_9ACTN|nr:DUF368 domain-containing protein [Arachnia propionica]AFN46399.1 putative membrane protein [Arachnia propionica F0230a]QCT37298.1 DUF368 domain-containing protein [Arachnia propionica]QUC10355.1 DUF368 domain-containing protein [Arachnia propionica]RPA17255.1 DUF368 domain-containing protein [Arachnia propionica]
MQNPRRAAGRFNPTTAVANLVRGMLIGLAELVPGVSGGTIALISGIYEPLINSASHVVSAVKRVVTGKFSEAGVELRKVRWGIVIPALLGMAIVVVAMAGVMKAFVGETPQLAKSLFLGMVLASVVVPALGIRREDLRTAGQRLGLGGLFLAAAVAAFLLTGLGGQEETVTEPAYWMVFGAAALAICALVLPGISGSFVLLTLGLYSSTLQAVQSRNMLYIVIFAAGAAVGLGLFVKGLNWLLEHKHAATMAVMSGLLLGSLRALVPWGLDGRPLAPGLDWPVPVCLALAGAVVVVGIVWVDRRLKRR